MALEGRLSLRGRDGRKTQSAESDWYLRHHLSRHVPGLSLICGDEAPATIRLACEVCALLYNSNTQV